MFEYHLGASTTSITSVLSQTTLAALGNSRIETFEFNPVLFAGDVSGSLRAAARKMLQDTGKRFISCHIPFARLDDLSDSEEEIRLCAISRKRRQLDEAFFFGSEVVVVHPSTEIDKFEPRQIRMLQLRRSLWELTATLDSHRLKLALECLPRQCLGNSLKELKDALVNLDPAIFGICLDVNHMMGAWRDLPELVEQLGDKLMTLHLSDYDGVDEKNWMPG